MTAIFESAGGLGLFLLGMIVMTEGLRSLAGDALRRFLARATTSPLAGVATGAATTALVQSSSATTVAAVGFVGAGLLAFPQALGIVFGANIGTTVTGWMIALLGFKLNIGSVALPLILLGALLRLFGRGGTAASGEALAGFGLLFVGIATLQHGMAGLEGIVTPDTFPPNTPLGRLALLGIGVVVTVVTQSSSAGVAATLAGVHTGTIGLPQAAAMVIGMDVGTTMTALVASLGGSIEARRTAYGHVMYNVFTGSTAFLLLTPYFLLWQALAPTFPVSNPEIVLVAFHSGFNILGVSLILPFTGSFAKLIEKLAPASVSPFARRLDASLLPEPDVAIAATSATLKDLTRKVFRELDLLLGSGRNDLRAPDRLALLSLAIDETRSYLARINTSADQEATYQRHLSAMHAVDHLDRLVGRCGAIDRVGTTHADPQLARLAAELANSVAGTTWLDGAAERMEERETLLCKTWQQLESERETYRRQVLERAAGHYPDAESSLAKLDAYRWLRRIAHHAWRIVHHLTRACSSAASVVAEELPAREEAEPPA